MRVRVVTNSLMRGMEGGADRYQRLVDAVLADGKLTRSETEQAIESQMDCYEEHGLAGEYGYDLDVYPWTINGDFGLSRSNPHYRLYSPQDPDASKLDPYLGQAMAICDAVFQPVESLAVTGVDWQVIATKRFSAIVQCLSNNTPEFARRIDPAWKDDSPEDAVDRIWDVYLPLRDSMGEREQSTIESCLQYASATRRTFGGEQ